MEPATARPAQQHDRLVAVAIVTLAVVALVLGVAAVAMVLIPPRVGATSADVDIAQGIADASFLLVTPVLGAFLALRRPGNPVGWLLIQIPFWLAIGFVTDGLARHAQPTELIGWLATVGSALSTFGFVALFLLFQLFPGHLPGPGWRWLPATSVVGGVLLAGTSLFSQAPVTPVVADLPLPLAQSEWSQLAASVNAAVQLLQLPMVIGTLALVVVRFRASSGVERQQLKWFGWAAVIVGTMLGLGIVTALLGAEISDGIWNAALGALVLLPIAASVAILRYRLWDIDRIVSRTISYGVVTVILAAAFVAVVLAVQTILADVTQAGSLAVVASTLVVFGLFQPVRRRVQTAVDRQFDRAGVDADHSVAELVDRLRDAVALDAIQADVLATVDRTLRPTGATLWLRRHETRTPEA
jgi:hypothetical protein